MGRRPNALVVEFFERGAKVSGNSNRYEHTCKRCGAVFPKGRVDGLFNHLLRKCPRVTDADRQLIFQHISMPLPHQQPVRNQSAVTDMPLLLCREDLPEVSLPAYQQHEQSALDTLAEVSRRHLDYSSSPAPATSGNDGQGKTLSEVLVEQALIAELSNYDPTSQESPTPQVDRMATTAMVDACPLVKAATAASQQLELAQATQSVRDGRQILPLDPQLNNNCEVLHFLQGIDGYTESVGSDTSMTWIPTVVKKLKDPPKVPSGAPTPGFGLLQMPKPGSKRKRFDIDRRKEVSNLRKQGACIRCRMLKKPCSGEDPCSTCQAVQSARLWKAKCLRTRLADEFTLWSSTLFLTKKRRAFVSVNENATRPATPGRVEVYFPSSSVESFSIRAKSYGSASVDDDTMELTLLNDDDAASDGLEQCSNQIVKACIINESSAFMKATIELAQVLIDTEEPAKATNSASAKRSCYNVQDELVRNVVELWSLTKLLTSAPNSSWRLQFVPSQDQQELPESNDASNESRAPELLEIAKTSASHSMIIAQLKANAESRCIKLGKIVMNELERRLLQRQQASPFATFLSAVILLSCVEMMSALFRSFDANAAAIDVLHEQIGITQENNSSRNGVHEDPWEDDTLSTQQESTSWPLEQPPSFYWTQGQNFSELLTMLLRMRALPPKTYHTPLGTLSANPDFSPPSRINGRLVKEYVEPHTRAAQAWLGPLKLDVAELINQRDRPTPTSGDGPEAWNMRFVSMLLLPEGMANIPVR